eukprot:UN16827
MELATSPQLKDRAEFQWRAGIPLAALVLALLAVPVAHTTPRKGRFAKIAMAILIYTVYTNFLVLARKWIESGQMSEALGLWWVHLLLTIVTLGLIYTTFGVFPGTTASRSQGMTLIDRYLARVVLLYTFMTLMVLVALDRCLH